MPIKNCIHHQEDKLTSLQFHLHSRNSIVRFAAPKREILYVTCNETMEREIGPLSTVYNSFLTPSLQFQSIQKNIFEMMNVRANFKGYRVETTRKAKRFDSIIDQTDERKRATNIEPPFVDRSSRYPGGRRGGGGDYIEKNAEIFNDRIACTPIFANRPLSRSPTTALQRYPFRVGQVIDPCTGALTDLRCIAKCKCKSSLTFPLSDRKDPARASR